MPPGGDARNKSGELNPRASLSNTASRETLASHEDITADGLAVDWIHHNIYYTDGIKSSIRLLSWDGAWHKTVAEEDLGRPRAIVTSPMNG